MHMGSCQVPAADLQIRATHSVAIQSTSLVLVVEFPFELCTNENQDTDAKRNPAWPPKNVGADADFSNFLKSTRLQQP